jgi:hypothetical protein
MRSRLLFALLVIFFANLSVTVAGVVSYEYTFNTPVVTTEGNGQWIMMKDCRTGGTPGAPALPSFGVKLLLPPGEGVESVQVIPGERQLLGTDFRIQPNQYEVPYSYTGPYEEVAPNPDIYESNRPYPYQLYSTPFAQGYCGHTLGFFTINPVSYNPVTGEVWWYPRMRVEVITAPERNAAARLQTLYYRDEQIQKNLERWVQNPELLSFYPEVQRNRQEEWDMVVITNAAMQPTFQTFADMKNRRGIRTFIQTTEWIYANVSGSDNAAKIRNYIITCYTTWHIKYVLLGGDGDASGAGNIIPHRGVYARSHYGGGDETDTDLPCDLYYGGLDGTWNTDGDAQYGEETPQEADYIAEVHVGRASVDNATEAARFVNKSTMYQRTPVVADCGGDDVLFAGELLWDDVPGVWTFGDTYMQEVRWGSSNHGYTTVGVDEPAIADTLWDKNYYPSEWSALTHLKPKLNAGTNLFHHLGHANETYACRFNSSDVTDVNMTNNGTNHSFYIIYTQGCYCGSFDYNDCIAEKWTVEINNGAVAVIMNSRYGWGYHQSTRGSSQYFHREFVDGIYREHLTHIALANDDSKVDCLPWINNDDMANRWCCLELNVFGDPELDMWTHEPQTLSPVYDPVYLIGTGSFEVDIPGMGGALVACNFGGQLIGRGYTDPTGHVTVTLDPGPTEPGTMEVVITAHNYLEYSGSVSVIPPAGPYVIYDSFSTTEVVGIANGQVDAGEQLYLTVSVENVGVETALSTTVTISTTDPYVTITDNTEFYGDILPSEVKSVTNGFAFTVASNTPDGHYVAFNVHVEEGATRDSWDSNFSLAVHAPIVNFTSLAINDGTGDSHLNPGETGTLTLTVTNSGSCVAQNLTVTMMTDNAYLQVTSGSGAIASLSPSMSGSPTPPYTVYVLPGCPDLNLAYLYFSITGDLGYQNSFIQELTLNPFWENVENGQGAWTHEAASDWTDQWHISTETAWSPTHAWKCGDTSTGTYANHDDARLMTPTINLPTSTQLRFMHQINAETSSYYPDSAYDGGIVEVSVNGGAWTQLASPQYNKHFRYSAGSGAPATHPFPGGIACFSGSISWSQATCDLSAYSGDVQIRFRFGSDNGTGLEGWYVDDIEIVRTSALLPPTNLQAGIVGSVVSLTWNSPGASLGLLGYNLYRNGVKIASSITAVSTTDELEGLPYDTYTYRVTAVYSGGESGFSNPASVVYTAEPDPVTDLTAISSGTDIVLHWTATLGAESYSVYRVTEPYMIPTPSDLIGTTAATSYTDVGVLNTLETAFYVVIATNSN